MNIRETLPRAAALLRTLERQALDAAGEASSFQPPTTEPVAQFASGPVSGCECANCDGMRNGKAPDPSSGCDCAACAGLVEEQLAHGDQGRHDTGQWVPGSKANRANEIETAHYTAQTVALKKLDEGLRAPGADHKTVHEAFQGEMTAAKTACEASHGVNGTGHCTFLANRIPKAASASREHLDHLVNVAAAVSKLEIDGPAEDGELPASLKGKGLIRGKPVATWPLGLSTARDGRRFIVDQRAVSSLLEDGNTPGTIVPFTYMHEGPEDPSIAGKNSGYMTHFSADSKFIYADRIYWTAAAAKDIASGERGFVSPDAYCQPVDERTYQPVANGAKTNTFLPLYWRAASLVPVPALANLPPASLATQQQLYSEDQARDEKGMWTAGGGGAGKAAESAGTPTAHYAAMDHHKAASTFHREQSFTGNVSFSDHQKAADAHDIAANLHGQAAIHAEQHSPQATTIAQRAREATQRAASASFAALRLNPGFKDAGGYGKIPRGKMRTGLSAAHQMSEHEGALLLQSLALPPQFQKQPPTKATQPPPVAGATVGKEIPMDPEILAALGFAPGTTPTAAQVKAAILKLAGEDTTEGDGLGNPAAPPAKGAPPVGAAPDAAGTHFHVHMGAGAEPTADAPVTEAIPTNEEKDKVEDKTKVDATAQAAAALAPSFADVARDAGQIAAKTVREQMAAEEEAKKIDNELSGFEKSGQLMAADREFFRKAYALDADKTRQTLSTRSRGATVPNGEVFGGILDPSISVDNLEPKEANEILSRAAAFHLEKGVEFPVALIAVRGGDPAEQAFHSQVLKCNPDWGKEKKNRSGVRGQRWPTSIRRGYTSQELDGDMLKYIGQQMKAGKIPTNLVPQELQSAALQRMQLGGEAASFQPPTKFGLAGFGFGYFQGEYGGSEIAPEVTGGANEEASYPIYGSEKLSVHVNAAGVPEPVGRNVNDIERSYWGVDFKKVTMHGYGNEVWADRRDQSAGDAVLPQGVMATVTEQALTIEKNKKELLQAAVLRNVASYASSNHFDLNTGNRQWNDKLSTPIQDWQGARVQLWNMSGAFPEISLIPVDVFETLRFHPQFLLAAQYAGMTHVNQPNAMVPTEMLVSILGTLVVPTCRISTTPGGSGAASPWGQDVIMAISSKGKVIAPRAFATVVSAGYPVVRGLADERSGLIGSDGVIVSDMYSVEVVTPSGLATTAGFLFQNATQPLTVS